MSLLTTASSFLPSVPAPAAPRIPRVLAIAGSDPSGGAGIQADLKSIAAHGGYGMAAITALTAQNTRGVSAVHVPPAAFLTAQLDAISQDITIDAVKIGMLGDAVRDRRRPQLAGEGPPRRRGPGPRDGGDERRPAAAGVRRGGPAGAAAVRGPDHPQPRRTRRPARRTRRRGLGRGAGTGQAARRPDRHHGPGEGRPPRRRRRVPRRAGQHRRAPGPGRRRGAGGAGAHPQQPRHRVLAVLGDRHRAGQNHWDRRAGGLGGRAPRGQALAAGGAAHLGGARRRHRQRPGPSLPPRPAAHPGPWPEP